MQSAASFIYTKDIKEEERQRKKLSKKNIGTGLHVYWITNAKQINKSVHILMVTPDPVPLVFMSPAHVYSLR